MEKIKILHLEDFSGDVTLVERVLSKSNINYDKIVVDSRAGFQEALASFKPDIILSDHSLPTFNSFEALKMAQDTGNWIPFILVTGATSEEFAADVMKRGADDYILKDRLQRLPDAILNLVEMQRLEEEKKLYMEKVISGESLMKEAERMAHVGSFSNNLVEGAIIWSDELYRILGYEPGAVEPSDEHFWQKVHPDDAKNVKERIDFAMAHLNSLSIDYRILLNDNTVRYIISRLTVIRNNAQQPVNVIGFIQDVTQLKVAENEIKALNESLEKKVLERTVQLHELNGELESFNYSVSHDLRSPLRIIDGFAQILVRNLEKKADDEDIKTLNVIKESASRMNLMIDSFLSLSRLGRVAINYSLVDIERQVRGVLEEVKNANPEMKATVNVKALPQARCDSGLLHQVWQNLISNAVKYSRKKPSPEVEIGYEEVNGKHAYYIKDNGAGFDMKNAGKLFNAFHRLHKVTEFDGTGVGLALAYRIIKKHGGEIWAKAEPENGATFYFTLPQ